jgi:hypothetical protein
MNQRSRVQNTDIMCKENTIIYYNCISPYNISLKHFHKSVTVYIGRSRAQAVSHRFPKLAARVRAQVRYCGVCGGQIGTGTHFVQVR